MSDKNKKSPKGAYTLGEILTLSKEELTSNWSRLASLIRQYEKIHWDVARKKAIEMLDSNSASEYIDNVRMNPEGMDIDTTEQISESMNNIPVQEMIPEKVIEPKNIYQKNYEQLVKLIPDLKQRLMDKQTIQGISNVIGYRGIIQIKPISIDSNKDNDIQLYHFVESGMGYVVETLLSIRVNVAKMTVEPLCYNTRDSFKSVYHRKNGCKRQLVDLQEQDNQNRLLSDWLENLIQHRHSFIWYEDPNAEIELFAKLDLYQFKYSEESDDELVEIEYDSTEDDTTSEIDEVNEVISGLIKSQGELNRKIQEQEKIINRKQDVIISPKQEVKEPDIVEYKEPLDWKEHINDDIPDFNIGFVQLVQAHVKVGVEQRDIDYINKNKQGMIFTPRKDAKVKKQGFRISRVGKIFFEGRSD